MDTRGWLDGWERHYPPDVFPSLWEKLVAQILAGNIVSSEEIYHELERKSDVMHEWIKARKIMLIPLSADIQQRAAELLIAFPRLVDTIRNRSKADPFVVRNCN